MKLIQEITIWNNGQSKQGKILDAFVVSLTLNTEAVFYYNIYCQNEDGSKGEKLLEGRNLIMPTEEYLQWSQDEFAWDFVASSLNLVIIGDYVAPQPPVVEEPVIEATPIEEAPVEESTEETPSSSL